MTVFILLMVLAIVLYHLWLDRRLERERRRRPAERTGEPAVEGRPDRRRA
ncbi:MAG: hypothetical protein K6T92_03375 [Candidatus Rokubacteria bacterium]|nr:hypothetical protein [Candidatus Rokubacteria bacterium]